MSWKSIAKEAIIDWKAKLGSRKFWVAIATLVSSLAAVFFDVEIPTEPLIGAAGILVAYLVGQSWVDKTVVQGQADIVKNESLLQAQQYVAYLENELAKFAKEDVDASQEGEG